MATLCLKETCLNNYISRRRRLSSCLLCFGSLAFLIKHIGLPRGKSFWAKFESTSCRGAVLQATDLLYPPRLPMLFASRAVCKFSSLIPKILTWIKYHKLHPPYSIHLPWSTILCFFFFWIFMTSFYIPIIIRGKFLKDRQQYYYTGISIKFLTGFVRSKCEKVVSS